MEHASKGPFDIKIPNKGTMSAGPDFFCFKNCNFHPKTLDFFEISY